VKSKKQLKIGKVKKSPSEKTNESKEEQLKPKIIFDL
tara:strand:- start:361 stop:471 length:111 start_codon:yes stop_codon:yes gene_type:complete